MFMNAGMLQQATEKAVGRRAFFFRSVYELRRRPGQQKDLTRDHCLFRIFFFFSLCLNLGAAHLRDQSALAFSSLFFILTPPRFFFLFPVKKTLIGLVQFGFC